MYSREKRTVKLKIPNEEFARVYITLFNGDLAMTEKELEIVAEFVTRYMKCVKDGVKQPYISKLVFSTDSKKEIKDKLGITPSGISNYIKSLKRKGCIVDEEGYEDLHPVLLPVRKLIFEFDVIEENEKNYYVVAPTEEREVEEHLNKDESINEVYENKEEEEENEEEEKEKEDNKESNYVYDTSYIGNGAVVSFDPMPEEAMKLEE